MRSLLWLAGCVVLIASQACVSGSGNQPGAGGPAQVRPSAPKSLTIAVQAEPTTFGELGVAITSAGSDRYIAHLAHDYLTVENERKAWIPQLATEPLSAERGTWRVNPDGSMDTTWSIRTGARWHDGTSFSVEDLLFAFQVYKDPQVPNRAGQGVELMQSAQTPDATTLVVHWSTPYFAADQAAGLFPLPRHLLEDLYARDKEAFVNSSRFTTEFVGLGPYRLARWEARFPHGILALRGLLPRAGAARNDRGALVLRPHGARRQHPGRGRGRSASRGRAPGGRAGAEAALGWHWPPGCRGPQRPPSLPGDPAPGRLRAARQRADEPRGAPGGVPRIRSPHARRFDESRPRLAACRQLVPPNHELRSQVESAIPQFPYDPAQAQQLLSQAGWVRGADGLLANQVSGEPFRLQLWNTQSSGAEREMNTLGEGWKAAGVLTDLYIIPAALIRDREHRAKLPGAGISGADYNQFAVERLHTRQATSAANRWLGLNRGGYSNPRVDALLDRLVVTIAPADRLALHRELLQEQQGDVAIIPLYWDLDPVLMVKGVKGVATAGGSVNLANVLEWDRD